MNRRVVTLQALILAVFVSILVLLTASTALAKTTLRFWIHEHPPEVNYIKEVLIPEFVKKHPDVNIEFSYFPHKDYTQKIMVAMATGTAPDFFDLGDWFYPTFTAKSLLDPVPSQAFGYKNLDALLKDYIPHSLDGLMDEGKLYGIPIQLNSFSLYINTAHFREAGLDPDKDAPKTWDDLVRVAQKLVKTENARITREGFDFPYNGPVWAMYTFDPLIRQFGGSILSADGKKATINSPAGVAALTMWRDLAYKYKVADPNLSVATGAVPNQDFTIGKVSMWTTGPWALEQIKANAEVYKDTVVAPIPQHDPAHPVTLLYGFAWTVNAKTTPDKKKLAWEFIAMAADRPTEWLLKLGFPQPRIRWYESAEAKKFPFLDTFIGDMARGHYLTRSVYFNEISQSVDRAIQRCLFNGMDPKESLDIAAREIDNVLQGK